MSKNTHSLRSRWAGRGAIQLILCLGCLLSPSQVVHAQVDVRVARFQDLNLHLRGFKREPAGRIVSLGQKVREHSPEARKWMEESWAVMSQAVADFLNVSPRAQTKEIENILDKFRPVPIDARSRSSDFDPFGEVRHHALEMKIRGERHFLLLLNYLRHGTAVVVGPRNRTYRALASVHETVRNTQPLFLDYFIHRPVVLDAELLTSPKLDEARLLLVATAVTGERGYIGVNYSVWDWDGNRLKNLFRRETFKTPAMEAYELRPGVLKIFSIEPASTWSECSSCEHFLASEEIIVGDEPVVSRGKRYAEPELKTIDNFFYQLKTGQRQLASLLLSDRRLLRTGQSIWRKMANGKQFPMLTRKEKSVTGANIIWNLDFPQTRLSVELKPNNGHYVISRIQMGNALDAMEGRK